MTRSPRRHDDSVNSPKRSFGLAAQQNKGYVAPSRVGTRAVGAHIDQELSQQFRIQLAIDGISAQEFLTDAITRYVSEGISPTRKEPRYPRPKQISVKTPPTK